MSPQGRARLHAGVKDLIETGLARTEAGLLVVAGTGHGAEVPGEAVTRAGCQAVGLALGCWQG